MKLFSWMHRKLHKDNIGSSSFKGSTIGSSCLFIKRECQSEHYLEQFKDKNTEEINEVESSDEIFPGFLTIGTLSVEVLTDPPTPTFDMLPYQETDTEAIPQMNYDLNIINDELENFLKYDVGCEGSDENESSNINKTYKEMEKEQNKNKCVTVVEYPLQGYHIASSIEIKKEKSCFKKLLRNSTNALGSSRRSAEDTQKESRKVFESPILKKLKRIKRLFPTKIHPQDISDPNNYRKDIIEQFDYDHPVSEGLSRKEENHHSKIHISLSQEENSMRKELNDDEGREHWINTDADYLVLEL